jgi:hypothetical protein
MQPYDHRTKAGNEGDCVKHVALVAAIHGLLAGHQGLFRYADAFAGPWESTLRQSGAWTRGIQRFARHWSDGNPGIRLWRQQWRADIGSTYPGSAQLAKRILSDRGSYAIQAFEIVEEHAAGLRRGLGAEAVLTRPARPADWDDWTPDLLFVDPPGLRSEEHPTFPTLGSLLALTESVSNALIWLPMQTEPGRDGTVAPLNASTVGAWTECAARGFRILAVRWSARDAMAGCLILLRFRSATAAEPVRSAIRDLVKTMGWDWRLLGVQNPT